MTSRESREGAQNVRIYCTRLRAGRGRHREIRVGTGVYQRYIGRVSIAAPLKSLIEGFEEPLREGRRENSLERRRICGLGEVGVES
jgi:hypothetical protein